MNIAFLGVVVLVSSGLVLVSSGLVLVSSGLVLVSSGLVLVSSGLPPFFISGFFNRSLILEVTLDADD